MNIIKPLDMHSKLSSMEVYNNLYPPKQCMEVLFSNLVYFCDIN